MRTILAASAALLAFCSSTAAQAQSGNIIEGIASFQADRIESLVQDQFLADLADNDFVIRFFPSVAEAVKDPDASAQRLLPAIQHSAQVDIDNLKNLARCLTPDNFDRADPLKSAASVDLLSAFIKDIRDEGKTPANFYKTYCEGNKKTPTAANASDPEANALKAAGSAITTFSQGRSLPANSPAVASFVARAGKLAGTSITAFSPVKAADEKKLAATFTELKDKTDIDVEQVFAALGALSDHFTVLKDNTKKPPPYLSIINDFTGLLAALGFREKDHAAFIRFRDKALFLASLKDAGDKSAEAVKDQLEQYVDDQTVFREKRSDVALFTWRSGTAPNTWCDDLLFFCEQMLFVNSYYGVSMAKFDSDGTGEKKLKGRAYGPIGIEYKILHLKGWPVAIGYAPFDIGAYVTAELQGDDYDPNIEDIKAPSAYLAFSKPNRPYAFLLGYQKKVKTAAGGQAEFGFFSVAFELPFFTIR